MTSSAQALSISLLTFRISPSFESYYNTKVQCDREKSYRRERKHASGKHFSPQGKRSFLPAKNNFRKKLLSVNRFLHKPGLSFLADRKRASIFVNTKKEATMEKDKKQVQTKSNRKEYTQANLNWLASKSKETGVSPLPKGICYKSLAEGRADGKHPGPRSIVTVHYTGRTIDGRIFDDTRGGIPAALRLSDLIDGWIIALQRMCIGDRWEIYIPAEMGYGKFSQPGIPGGSTLIFDIELLGIA